MLEKYKIGEKVLVEAIITSMAVGENGEMVEVRIVGAENDDYTSYVCLNKLGTIHQVVQL